MTPDRALPRLLLDAVIYFVLAAAAVSSTRFDGGVAFLWVASAYLIARLSMMPAQRWRPVLIATTLASFCVTGLVGLGWRAAPPIAIVNVAEAVIAAALIRRFRIPEAPFQSLGWLAAFVGAAGLAAPLVSALGGATIAHLVMGRPWAGSMGHWFAGHALGNLTFTPIATLLLRGDVRAWMAAATRRQTAETAVLMALVLATSIGVFAQSTLPLLFLPLLPIILATFRIGRFGAAGSIVILAAVGGVYTLLGHGPISLISASMGHRAQFFQFYLAATVLTVLPVAADLARRGRLFRALRDSEARYRVLAETSIDIILNLDPDGRIRFVSPSIRQLGGYDPAELIGRNAVSLVAPEHWERVREAHLATLSSGGEPVSVEYLALARSGESRWCETHARAIVTDAGKVDGIVSVVRDISARKAHEARLAEDALTDALTALPNRRAFMASLDRQVAGCVEDQPCGCIALFDIDHFKRINDSYGHAAGDQVLRNFAEIARRTVRADDRVARIGGEEFAVLLPDVGIEQAELVCDRLRQAVAAAVTRHDGAAIRVTVSGGVALLVHGADQTLKAADAALYRAKDAGRDRLALAA